LKGKADSRERSREVGGREWWGVSEHRLFLMPLAHLWWLAVAGIAVDPALRTDPSNHRGLTGSALVASPTTCSGRAGPGILGRKITTARPATRALDHSSEKPKQENSGQPESSNLYNREINPGSLGIDWDVLPYGLDHDEFVSTCYRQG